MWYIYTMEYNSATKMNEIMLFAATWMDLRDCHTEWSQRNIVWHPLYEESKKKLYKWTYLQNRKRLTDLGKGILRDFGMDMYTLLYLIWITSKVLLSSTGNSGQRYVAAWVGGEFGGEWIHVCVWLSPFSVYLKLSQHCLLIVYTPIQNKVLKTTLY